MLTRMPLKVALIVLMIAAAVINRPGPILPWWFVVVTLSFGFFNVVFNTSWPATAVAVAMTIATLLWPALFGSMALFVFFIWPAWILARRASIDAEPNSDIPLRTGHAQIAAAGLVIAVAIASLVYRYLVHHRLEQTSALFVGIPVLLSMLVIFLVRPRSAAGVACKAVTIGLLVSMCFLWEGVVCVLMSAPLFYAVAVLIGAAVDLARQRSKRTQSVMSCVAVLVLMPMSMEGVTDNLSFNRDEWIARTSIVPAPSDAVGDAILQPPRFNRALPLYLRAGFPRPTATRIERTSTGDRWIITMTGGEMLLNGMESRAGDLTLEVEERRPGFMRFRAIGDDSHMTHFLTWREAEVEWEPFGADATRVTWKLRYRRGLDPAWYFGPWERYATGLAAEYLIQSVATP